MSGSDAKTSAGTGVFIGPAPATYDLAGFGAVDFKEVGEVADAGSFGRQYNLVTFNPLKSRRTVKRKGSFNDGSITLQLAIADNDDGQILAKEALASDDSYAIKIEKQDGSVSYFTAQVLSFVDNIGSVDNINTGSVQLEIDNDILKG